MHKTTAAKQFVTVVFVLALFVLAVEFVFNPINGNLK